MPPLSSILASVNMPSTLPTHRSYHWVAARVTPPTMRWPVGCRSAGPSTAAAAPEPSVRLANSLMKSLRFRPPWFRRSMVLSCTWSASSPSTTRAYLIWPESIMPAATLMALTKPRQAFAMSKLIADVGRPRPWCSRTATEGSRCGRVTEVLMSRPTSSGLMPAAAMARRPASIAASWKDWFSPQLRRSRTPATRSSRPIGRRRRRSTPPSFSSMSAEVVTRSATVVSTARTAALRKRTVALPGRSVSALGVSC